MDGTGLISVSGVLLRCVIVPHIGSATLETRKDMAMLAAQNLIEAIRGGQMPARVDLSSYLL